MLIKIKMFSVLIVLFTQSGFTFADDGSNFDLATKANQAIDIGSRLELFIDKFLIEKMENTRLVLHEPEDKGPVLNFDKSWEGPFSAYCTVIKAAEKYQMYYRGLYSAGKDGSDDETTCYAESNDGIIWRKPDLEIYKRNGTLNNNIVLAKEDDISFNAQSPNPTTTWS